MPWYEELERKIADYLPDLEVRQEELLSRHTSFRVGGPAKRMAFPRTGEQLVMLQRFAEECGARPFVMGNGTNLLAPDEGVDRLVISTSELSRLELGAEENTLMAEAGVPLARLADFACRHGLSGLEFAHGIPGTLGGAVSMNAGAYGGEMVQVVRRVRYLSPELELRETDEPQLSYRHSRFSDTEDVILGAELELQRGEETAIREQMDTLMEKRRASQPLNMPSAGSTFKRPVGGYAAALIDQAGLKGFAVGGAQVSEKHAGFVVNRGGASFEDVLRLMEEIRERVYAASGITLEPEVKIVRP